MRHDTRKEILDTAKQLFNERGYNDVSTRDIADALGISKGNLTYYFKKKDEIIEAILSENTNTRAASAPLTLAGLNLFFADVQKTVQENAFYFWHYTQLAQLSSTIGSMQKEAFQENTSLLEQTFTALRKDGMLREEQYSGEYTRLINTVLLSSIYWVPFCALKNTASKGFLEQAWSLLYPYLTDRGMKELKSLHTNFESV